MIKSARHSKMGTSINDSLKLKRFVIEKFDLWRVNVLSSKNL